MGSSKGGGYKKLKTVTKEQEAADKQAAAAGTRNQQLAMRGYEAFLPGGKGNDALINQANARFNQSTVPSIMNAFGSGAKTSSALNQALAAGAANLNTDIAAQQAQNMLYAAQGASSLGLGQGGLGQKDQFAYAQRQKPLWQTGVETALGVGGQIAGSMYGVPPLSALSSFK